MTSNGNANGHYHAASPSSSLSPEHALDKSKHMASSPHKLMIGVPPATTPKLSSSTTSANGTSAQHSSNQNDARTLSNGTPILTSTRGSDLVSLAALVERLANYGYESLQNLAETLPSLPSSSKRAKIFNTALDVRKQFIKLLVLSRWSKDVSDLQKTRNIIALLSEQQWQHEDVFAGLTDIRKILPNARMRNADLPTAIDVLQTGTYTRLPASIKIWLLHPSLSPTNKRSQSSRASKMPSVHAWPVEKSFQRPFPTTQYTMARCTFAFKASLKLNLLQAAEVETQQPIRMFNPLYLPPMEPLPQTTLDSRPSAEDRWWLLDLNFDVTPTGSCAASSTKMFPKKPKKAYRERLRIWGDQELAPKSQSHEAEEPKSDQADGTADAETAGRKANKCAGQG
ncbi:uncharacterized protein UTRI_02369 [Ustilago trichophora]|uniref:Mediator of RNA polymerase II transcription subunit 14 n=1 Tax=Ustilago trichophora TaxID=86804 RepID=A0A5C3E7P3_9BASI|nr:uncharacterized protein UTRI_02369 [Ustilago trichophora]